jgi:Tfp pilus assembly protein PilO
MMHVDAGREMIGNQQPAQIAAASAPVSLKARLNWNMRRWLRILGWPGVAGLGLLVACVSLYVSAIRPAQERMQEMEDSVAFVREQMAHDGKATREKLRSPAEQLAEFYRAFPTERYSPQWLEKLIAVAEQNDLTLNEGEYKTSRDKVGRLVRYQIMLPVSGEYPQIREFLAELPAEIPIMALEDVQFERKNIADSMVEARIRLVLYLEQGS